MLYIAPAPPRAVGCPPPGPNFPSLIPAAFGLSPALVHAIPMLGYAPDLLFGTLVPYNTIFFSYTFYNFRYKLPFIIRMLPLNYLASKVFDLAYLVPDISRHISFSLYSVGLPPAGYFVEEYQVIAFSFY